MTCLPPTVSLRRDALQYVTRSLPPLDLSVLLTLSARACPSTGRVWISPGRLAEDLGLTSGLIEQILVHLGRDHHLTTFDAPGNLRGLEIGSLLVRADEPPMNLPVEPLV